MNAKMKAELKAELKDLPLPAVVYQTTHKSRYSSRPEIIVRRLLLVLSLTFTGVSCISHPFDNRVDQWFDIGSDGSGIIRDVKIVYGDLSIPRGTNLSEISASHRTVRSEQWTVPVPQNATISWKSENGISHEVELPVIDLVKGRKHFKGFKFIFIDDRLDVYIKTEAARKGQRFTNTIEERVFSNN